jgi:hypothetical protein
VPWWCDCRGDYSFFFLLRYDVPAVARWIATGLKITKQYGRHGCRVRQRAAGVRGQSTVKLLCTLFIFGIAVANVVVSASISGAIYSRVSENLSIGSNG